MVISLKKLPYKDRLEHLHLGMLTNFEKVFEFKFVFDASKFDFQIPTGLNSAKSVLGKTTVLAHWRNLPISMKIAMKMVLVIIFGKMILQKY